MEASKKPAQFEIDGKEYPIPDIETLNMDEAMIMYDYSGMTIDEIDETIGLHPGLIAGFMHVSYSRKNPGASKAAVTRLIRGANMMDAVKQFAKKAEEAEEEDESTDSQKNKSDSSEPGTKSSDESLLSSEAPTTESSANGSAVVPEESVPPTTGPPVLDTPPTSDPTKSG